MAKITPTNYTDPSVYSNPRSLVTSPVTPGINPSVPTPSSTYTIDTSYGTLPQYTGTDAAQAFNGAPSTAAWGNAGATPMIDGQHELTNYAMNRHVFPSPQVQEVANKTIDKLYISLPTIDELIEEAVQKVMETGVDEQTARDIVAKGMGGDDGKGLEAMLTQIDPATGLSRYDQMLLSASDDIINTINGQAAGNIAKEQAEQMVSATKERLVNSFGELTGAYTTSGEVAADEEQRAEAEQVMEISIAASKDPEKEDEDSEAKQINDMLVQNFIGAQGLGFDNNGLLTGGITVENTGAEAVT